MESLRQLPDMVSRQPALSAKNPITQADIGAKEPRKIARGELTSFETHPSH